MIRKNDKRWLYLNVKVKIREFRTSNNTSNMSVAMELLSALKNASLKVYDHN